MRYDIIVVGGGPAGLTAGFYLSRAGFKTLLIERKAVGGQAAEIPMVVNYPGFPKGISGRDLMRRLAEQARGYGLKIKKGEVTAVGVPRVRLKNGRPLSCRAVVLATGSKFKDLNVPGEKRLQGRGVYHAAWGQASRFKGQVVGVAGGGETAAHQALALAEHAKRVVMFVRGKEIRAISPLSAGVRRNTRIDVRHGVVVRRMIGEGRLEAVETTEGRMQLDALFVLVGKEPCFPAFRRGARLFFAGDAKPGNFKQVAVAAADGMFAAMACERYLGGRA
ncbi:MAG: FAD-dependent oxidoreductase [Elusimicrobiota bacterium]